MISVYYCIYTPGCGSAGDAARMEHRLGRSLLAGGLEKITGYRWSPEELERSLSFSDSGKPMLPAFPAVHFNITHCEGLAACAFAGSPVGLDAEVIGAYVPILEKKVLSDPERTFLEGNKDPAMRREWFHRLWTLKEAYVKMTGSGLDTDLHSFSFSFDPAGSSCRHPICSDDSTACWQTILPGGRILSLCTSKQEKENSDPVLIPVQSALLQL